jgi:TRAP-type C4-dicarboxylate transport system substrate-binding protein
MIRTLFRSCVLAGALASAAMAAQADTEITISSWVGPKHPVNFGGYEPFMNAVEQASGGSVTFRLFTGGALLGAKATLAGIRDGIADTGIIALTYHPAEFPHAQLVADLALWSDDPLIAAGAVTEFNLLHCPPCLEEFLAQGLVYTGTYSTAPYTIIGRRPINGPADLAGLKVRTPGAIWDRWVQYMDAVPVNLPASDMYESLERGITDLVLQPVAALRSYSLWDVATDITHLNLGTFHSLSLLGYGRNAWRSYDAGVRKLLLDNAPVALIGASQGYVDLDREVAAESDALKVTIHPPSEALVAATRAFAEADRAALAEIARTQHGIAEPEPLIETFLALLDKWRAIIDPIRDDQAKMRAALKAEVFDKLDPATYGM